jgi:thymidylate synthase (FAD)
MPTLREIMLANPSSVYNYRDGRHPGIINKPQVIEGVGMYLGPTIVLTSRPDVDLGFYAEHLSSTYGEITDSYVDSMLTTSTDADRKLVMACGQGCYSSHCSKFTDFDEADRYTENLMKSKHFSVFEHVNYTVFCAGVSRTWLAEITRHRHTDGPSVQSQRYCNREVYRFVARPEYVDKPELLKRQAANAVHALNEYDFFSKELAEKDLDFSKLSPRDARFAANQSARGALPGWIETNGFWTWNIRSIIHILSLRGATGAEPEIRRWAWYLLAVLKTAAPEVFAPFGFVDDHPVNGWKAGLTIPFVG